MVERGATSLKLIKSVFDKIRSTYQKGKIEFFSLSLCYLFCAALIITMPIFTYRSNLNNITIVLALIFGAALLVYSVLFKKIYIEFYVFCFVSYLFVTLVSTAIGSKMFSSWRTILTTTLLGISLFEFVACSRNYSFVPFCFVLASLLLCVSIFIEYRDSILSFDIDRLGAVFGDLNDVGSMIVTGAMFCLYFAYTYKNLLFRIIMSVIFLIFGFFIFLTGSRGALLTLFVSLLVFLFVYLWKKHKAFCFSVVAFSIIAGFIFLNLPFMSDFKERILGALISLLTLGNQGDSSASKRLFMTLEGLELWASNPILGNGCASFYLLSNQNTFSHSTFSELFCSFGLIGAFLWSLPMIYYSTKGQMKPLARLFSLGFMLPASFSYVLVQSKFPLAVYGVICGMCFAKSSQTFSFISVRFNKKFAIEYNSNKNQRYYDNEGLKLINTEEGKR